MAKRSAGGTRPRVIRPKAVVLDDRALVSAQNLVKPPPNQFTHQVMRAQPDHFDRRKETADGKLPAGSLVVLMVRGSSPDCRVIDGRGLYVTTAFAGLRPLPEK